MEEPEIPVSSSPAQPTPVLSTQPVLETSAQVSPPETTPTPSAQVLPEPVPSSASPPSETMPTTSAQVLPEPVPSSAPPPSETMPTTSAQVLPEPVPSSAAPPPEMMPTPSAQVPPELMSSAEPPPGVMPTPSAQVPPELMSSAEPPPEVMPTPSAQPVLTTKAAPSSAQPGLSSAIPNSEAVPSSTKQSQPTEPPSVPTSTDFPATSTSSQVHVPASITSVVAQPSPTQVPEPNTQTGVMEGNVQQQDLPLTTITSMIDSAAAGKVAWQIIIPEQFDYKLYSPIKLGLALPYALLVALQDNSDFMLSDHDAFTATIILSFPRGYQLIVQFDSHAGTGTPSFSVQANGFYDDSVDFEGISSISMKLWQLPNQVVSGSCTLPGKIRLNFKITGIGLGGSTTIYGPKFRVQFSTMEATSDLLTFSTTSSIDKARKRREKPRKISQDE